MRRFMLSSILASSVVLCLSVSGQSEVVDRVVAVVNGEPITLSMVEDMMNAIWLDPQAVPKSPQAALQRLIDHKLKLQEARRLGADVIVSQERLSRELVKVASRFASPEDVAQALERRGITQEDLEENLIEEIMIQEMIDRKFRLFVEVTDVEASEFFQRHRDEFAIPETVLLDQVFFQLAPDADQTEREAVRKEAEEVLRKLRGGDDFSKYARQISMLDYVNVDQLIPVVAAVVSRLEVGEISDLIETPAGYFIVKLNDRRPARPATFDEVKDRIKERLIHQKTDAELRAWLKEQRRQADIRLKVEL